MKDFAQQKWIHKANLYWIVNGKVMETIMSNVPYPVARKKKNELDRTTHYKPGKLVVISVREKDPLSKI